MHRRGMIVVWGIFFVVMIACAAFGEVGAGCILPLPSIPFEPGPNDPRYVGWNTVYSLPLIKVDYDLDNDGRIDYSVIRVVLGAFYHDDLSVDTVNEISQVYYLAKVFPKVDMVYVTAAFGLFYCLDLDQDGRCDLMWKDMEEDGINGNEEIYDSPSGMFKEFIEKSN